MALRSVLVALGAVLLASSAISGPVDRSLRPVPRPADAPMAQIITASVVLPQRSLRPRARPDQDIVTSQPDITQASASNSGLQSWIKGFRSRAIKAGIKPTVYDAAMRGVRYDPEVIRRDRNQSEFTKTIWDYLDSAASATRIKNGKAALREHNRLLTRIEAKYGVEKEVVAAVWGLESAYGTFRGKMGVMQSLATLAYDARRKDFFQNELLAALKILQAGDVSPQNMTGSWAGAMGHTQFIPTSYLTYAVDFTGDGKRDIWSDDPTDALASTANYLARHGWVKGQPWGVEIKLPRGFDYELAKRKIQKMPSDWARLGVVGMDGRAVRNYGKASVLLPAGAQGAAFMIFKNFAVIEKYNTADAYVIGVGHLSDRIKGGKKIQGDWPRGDRALTFKERIELQKRLIAAGFDTKKLDGKIGPLTIAAVRDYQRSIGLIPDGYASLAILQRLRR